MFGIKFPHSLTLVPRATFWCELWFHPATARPLDRLRKVQTATVGQFATETSRQLTGHLHFASITGVVGVVASRLTGHCLGVAVRRGLSGPVIFLAMVLGRVLVLQMKI